MAIKITDRIVSVTRRGFLGSTAGVIAASGAAILPNGDVQAEISELEQMAHALHQAVGRHADRNVPFFSESSNTYPDSSIKWALENLRYCSVDEIQHFLKPLFEGGAS